MKTNYKLNATIDRVLDDHVAQTRVQRNTLRELILDAIEQAGFFIGKNVQVRGKIVGNANNSPSSSYAGPLSNVPHPNDYGKCDPRREMSFADMTALDEDNEDLQSLMDRDRE